MRDLAVAAWSREVNDDSGRRRDRRPETFAQGLEVGQSRSVEFGFDGEREFLLAAAFMGECERPDHDATGGPGKELEHCHGLTAQ